MCRPTCLILGVVKIKRFGDGVSCNRPLRVEDEHLRLPLALLSLLAFGKLLQQGCRMRSRGLNCHEKPRCQTTTTISCCPGRPGTRSCHAGVSHMMNTARRLDLPSQHAKADQLLSEGCAPAEAETSSQDSGFSRQCTSPGCKGCLPAALLGRRVSHLLPVLHAVVTAACHQPLSGRPLAPPAAPCAAPGP